MYGFTGYGTNEYATSRRTTSGIIGPVIKLVMRMLQNTYNIEQALMLRFRNSTLSNPEGNTNITLEL